MLQLSERMGMTKAELGQRMSAEELTERRGLALAQYDEHQRAQKKG